MQLSIQQLLLFYKNGQRKMNQRKNKTNTLTHHATRVKHMHKSPPLSRGSRILGRVCTYCRSVRHGGVNRYNIYPHAGAPVIYCWTLFPGRLSSFPFDHVCVCVCMREKERERERVSRMYGGVSISSIVYDVLLDLNGTYRYIMYNELASEGLAI